MKTSKYEVKVGLFVFLGLALLAGLLLQFSKGTTFFRHTYEILLRASNVGGLKKKASVLMSGVQVGTVHDIKLGPEGTNVTMVLRIYGEYVIHQDARFVIEQSGFLGDNYVAILPTENKGDILHDHDNATADAPFNLQEVARSAGGFLKRIDETANRLNDAIADVRRLVLNEQTLTNLSTGLGNFRTVSERAITAVDNINLVVISNTPSVNLGVSNLLYFSQQVNDFATSFNNVVTTNTADIGKAVKNIEYSSLLLKNLLSDIQSGKGLAGSVIENEAMAADMSQIIYNLSVTTSNLNRLGLWGVLWQHKLPKTNPPPTAPLSSPKARPE
jgi:ABC-type transporter Mla subunit MlaD